MVMSLSHGRHLGRTVSLPPAPSGEVEGPAFGNAMEMIIRLALGLGLLGIAAGAAAEIPPSLNT